MQSIYTYSIECLLNLLICDTILLMFAFCTGHLWEMLFWLLSFTFLRNNIGGFHANSHLSCISLSIVIGIASIYINKFCWHFPLITYGLLCICLYTILKLKPVTHSNHPTSEVKIRRAKNNGILVFLIELLIVLTLKKTYPLVAATIATGILTATFFFLVGFALRSKINNL